MRFNLCKFDSSIFLFDGTYCVYKFLSQDTSLCCFRKVASLIISNWFYSLIIYTKELLDTLDLFRICFLKFGFLSIFPAVQNRTTVCISIPNLLKPDLTYRGRNYSYISCCCFH